MELKECRPKPDTVCYVKGHTGGPYLLEGDSWVSIWRNKSFTSSPTDYWWPVTKYIKRPTKKK